MQVGKNSTTGPAIPEDPNEAALRHWNKKIFDYLMENLQVNVNTSPGGGYYEEPRVEVIISLRDPETGKWANIGDSASIR